MKQLNILIVEDESIVALEIESYIKKLGYHVVDICSNAEDTLHDTEVYDVDIILMDICLKGKRDGVETAEIIKEKQPQTEIIFLTAHLDDYNVDRAVKLDPVAYLSKPFNRDELRVFLKIAERKLTHENNCETNLPHITVLDDEFSYDFSNHTLLCCNEVIHLTKKENDLLALLIEHKNTLVDFEMIEHVIWPDKITTSNTIRTLVKRVRQKLKHKFIETIPSRGYKIVIP